MGRTCSGVLRNWFLAAKSQVEMREIDLRELSGMETSHSKDATDLLKAVQRAKTQIFKSGEQAELVRDLEYIRNTVCKIYQITLLLDFVSN